MSQTQYRNIGKGCEGILPQSKGLNLFTKVKKGTSDLQNRQTNFFQKVSEKSTRKRIEARTKYLTQKVAATNVFPLTNQLHILCLWYHFEQ